MNGVEVPPNMRVQRTRPAVRLLLLVALSAGIAEATGLSLELGQRLPKSAVNLDEVVMVNPSQLEQAYLVRENAVEYTVCSTLEKGITYIAPRAEGFKTPESVKVGMTFAEVRERGSEKPKKYPGYLFAVMLPSGWYAGFVQGDNATDGELKDETKVSLVFKSRWLW
jgi:hypothetical protein